MFKEFFAERRKARYHEAVHDINSEIFHYYQKKLATIRMADAFTDPKELQEIIQESENAINYFITLHNENIARLEALTGISSTVHTTIQSDDKEQD